MKELGPNDPQTCGDGRYTLLGILGEGSMGRTYLADSEHGKVAVKMLYPSRLATAKDLELFVREASVLQKMSHSRIPSYVDAFDEGEGDAARYHLVQQWVDGPMLRDVIKRGDRFDEAQMSKLLRELLVVLDYMHTCDPPVVHRDIKPENILIRNADEMPVLVDFGAVREVVRLTMGGGSTIIGTYGYMPPEQLMGRAVPGSDIYSLGVTVLEVLTRQTPQDLHGQDVKRLIESANVSERMRRLLRRMCAPSLNDRYETAAQVLADLDATAGGGALVHAGSIEKSMDERERAEATALKKASTPGIVHIGYMALISTICLAVVVGVGILVQMLATSFQGAFLVAGIVSGAGLLTTLILLGLRYRHDAWEPPNNAWVKVRGEVSRHSNIYQLDGNGRPTNKVLGFHVHYEFKVARGEHEASIPVEDNSVREQYPVGKTFDVYYQRANPAWHEIQDFRHDADNVMSQLFDRSVRHTPE